MLIKEMLMDQEVFGAIANVDQFTQDNNIDWDSFIQEFRFDKSVFADRAEVVEWLAKYGYSSSQITEDATEWLVVNFQPGIFDEVTIIEVRRGVSITVGRFVSVANDNPMVFSLKNKDGIKFKEDVPSIIEIAKVVEGYHASYGKVKITKEDLQSMKRNFDEGVVGIDISFDFEHNQAEAAAWVQKLFLSDDGNTLLAQVKWTPDGALALSGKKFRYFSPEFSHNYVHPHTRKEHGTTLLGGGLVNRPFLKMEAIVEMNEQNKGITMSTITLKDHEDKVGVLQAEIKLKEQAVEAAKTQIVSLKEENTKLSSEIATIKEEAEKKAKEAKNEKLFSEGKINAAQLKALNEGKDAHEVMALATEMNNTPNGKPPGKDAVMLTDEERAVCKMLDLTEEEYRKANPQVGA